MKFNLNIEVNVMIAHLSLTLSHTHINKEREAIVQKPKYIILKHTLLSIFSFKAIMRSFLNFFYMMLLIITAFNISSLHSGSLQEYSNSTYGNSSDTTSTMNMSHAHLNHRKLLLNGSCTNRDLSISQSKGSSTGIPQFIVEIVNTCISECEPSNIHVHCGWFASARIVNPTSFKRLSFDDCLVNGGMPLRSSQIIRFTYSNSFMYPISFKSATFC